MSKHYRSIALLASCMTFILSSCIYNSSESGVLVSVNLLLMVVSAYLIVRIMDSILDFSE